MITMSQIVVSLSGPHIQVLMFLMVLSSERNIKAPKNKTIMGTELITNSTMWVLNENEPK